MSDNKNIDLPYINNHVCPLVCQKSSKDFENRTRFHAEPDSSNSFLIALASRIVKVYYHSQPAFQGFTIDLRR